MDLVQLLATNLGHSLPKIHQLGVIKKESQKEYAYHHSSTMFDQLRRVLGNTVDNLPNPLLIAVRELDEHHV